jgi:hypothetical protein
MLITTNNKQLTSTTHDHNNNRHNITSISVSIINGTIATTTANNNDNNNSNQCCWCQTITSMQPPHTNHTANQLTACSVSLGILQGCVVFGGHCTDEVFTVEACIFYKLIPLDGETTGISNCKCVC